MCQLGDYQEIYAEVNCFQPFENIIFSNSTIQSIEHGYVIVIYFNKTVRRYKAYIQRNLTLSHLRKEFKVAAASTNQVGTTKSPWSSRYASLTKSPSLIAAVLTFLLPLDSKHQLALSLLSKDTLSFE